MAKVSRGNYHVSVFHCPKTVRGQIRDYYELRWREFGAKFRESVTGKEAALARASEILDNLSKGSPGSLTEEDLREFLWAKSRLGTHSIREVVEAFLKESVEEGRYLDQVIVDFLIAQGKRGIGQLTVDKYRSCLGQFFHSCGQLTAPLKLSIPHIHAIAVEDIDAYLSRIPDPTTRKTHRQAIVALFRWARNKGHLPPDVQTVAERTDNPKVKPKDPVPFDVDTLTRILRRLEDEAPNLCVPVALGAFAGLRTSEICRLTKLEFPLYLTSDITKTNRRRVVQGYANLRGWIMARSGNGYLSIPIDWQARVSQICKAHNIAWVKNGLRKGFVSHAVAYEENISKVALMSGHSESVLRSYYQGLKTKEEANAWFTIFPS